MKKSTQTASFEGKSKVEGKSKDGRTKIIASYGQRSWPVWLALSLGAVTAHAQSEQVERVHKGSTEESKKASQEASHGNADFKGISHKNDRKDDRIHQRTTEGLEEGSRVLDVNAPGQRDPAGRIIGVECNQRQPWWERVLGVQPVRCERWGGATGFVPIPWKKPYRSRESVNTSVGNAHGDHGEGALREEKSSSMGVQGIPKESGVSSETIAGEGSGPGHEGMAESLEWKTAHAWHVELKGSRVRAWNEGVHEWTSVRSNPQEAWTWVENSLLNASGKGLWGQEGSGWLRVERAETNPSWWAEGRVEGQKNRARWEGEARELDRWGLPDQWSESMEMHWIRPCETDVMEQDGRVLRIQKGVWTWSVPLWNEAAMDRKWKALVAQCTAQGSVHEGETGPLWIRQDQVSSRERDVRGERWAVGSGGEWVIKGETDRKIQD